MIFPFSDGFSCLVAEISSVCEKWFPSTQQGFIHKWCLINKENVEPLYFVWMSPLSKRIYREDFLSKMKDHGLNYNQVSES